MEVAGRSDIFTNQAEKIITTCDKILDDVTQLKQDVSVLRLYGTERPRSHSDPTDVARHNDHSHESVGSAEVMDPMRIDNNDEIDLYARMKRTREKLVKSGKCKPR